TRPPPRTTLFPYTTLFRSEEKANRGIVEYRGFDVCFVAVFTKIGHLSVANNLWDPRLPPESIVHSQSRSCSPRIGSIQTQIPLADRKSTRLNSSHSQISYA